ncbi:MAG: hypothetical protein ACTH31_07795, partial [Pseudoclavibacter sp.]
MTLPIESTLETAAESVSDAAPSAVRDLRALPKGHLHLHMEAGMRPATLAQLAERVGVVAPPTTGFTGFTEF